MDTEPLSFDSPVAGPATPIRDAIAERDVPRLLELVQTGTALGDDGPRLLKSAIEAELADARHTGGEAHVDLTAVLLIAGADPRRPVDGASAVDLADEHGHWFAALLIDRWGRPPAADPDPLPPPQPQESIWALDMAIEVERFRDAYDMLAAGADVHAEVGRNSLLVQALYLEEDGYRNAGQWSGLQAGGEGPRWEGRLARAVP